MALLRGGALEGNFDSPIIATNKGARASRRDQQK